MLVGQEIGGERPGVGAGKIWGSHPPGRTVRRTRRGPPSWPGHSRHRAPRFARCGSERALGAQHGRFILRERRRRGPRGAAATADVRQVTTRTSPGPRREERLLRHLPKRPSADAAAAPPRPLSRPVARRRRPHARPAQRPRLQLGCEGQPDLRRSRRSAGRLWSRTGSESRNALSREARTEKGH